MKKKSLIKLALIGLASTACLAAQDSAELDQTLSMGRRGCRGGYRRGCSGRRDCSGRRGRGCNGYYGAKTRNSDGTYSCSSKSKCRGKNSCRADSNDHKGSCNGNNNCNGNSNGSCNGKTDRNGDGDASCSGPGGCGSKNSSMNDTKKDDKNVEKRYESSF